MTYTDETPMPWGKYKGEKMANVPADYLLWFCRDTLDEDGKFITEWILNDDNCKYDVNAVLEGVYFTRIWDKPPLEELIEHFKK